MKVDSANIISGILFVLLFSISVQATTPEKETVCFASFNSINEEQVFRKYLSKDKYDFVNLLPYSPDTNWLERSCQKNIKCDHLLVSGHFGGIFFGEHSKNILSLKSMLGLSSKASCSPFFGNIKSVYLMGCNTLAAKQADHRSLDEYLSILLVDGLPIGLAEEVAATRYLNYGQSMESQFKEVFYNANYISGFKSTSPLGHQIEPSLHRYFKRAKTNSLPQTKAEFSELASVLSWTSFRYVKPDSTYELKRIKANIKSLSKDSVDAWKRLVHEYGVRENLFFILDTDFLFGLKHLLKTDIDFRKRFISELERAHGELLSYPVLMSRIMKFRKDFYLIKDQQEQTIKELFWSEFFKNRKSLNYLSSSQLCDMAKYQSRKDNQDMIERLENKYGTSSFLTAVKECAYGNLEPTSQLYQCLQRGQAWECLKHYRSELDVPACRYAQSLNRNSAKEDHMLWFCYSNMLDYESLNRADCLRLTRSFKHLRNQLHMNWNCMNRL
jgi:hypothetical protein